MVIILLQNRIKGLTGKGALNILGGIRGSCWIMVFEKGKYIKRVRFHPFYWNYSAQKSGHVHSRNTITRKCPFSKIKVPY